ncbi:Amino acid transporter LysE [Magnetospirillum sp. LM-5]|uniref:LysE family translocator n=1 Tax=Magnetospirillum sp. LM-5 TaxID=2681466 RepID=UPI0013809A3E|nr:LysE family translocator [Magnetospirillum sp. LM-5]CAA7616089.1 Amino acid transporter LysE [Magnetospirillum sp. LM-5]
MDFDTWLIYLAAAIGLSLSPGPNSLLALTHGALYGQARALWTVAGGALGFVIVIAASMFGIGALLQASAHWLVALKWIGGAYLVWLGIGVWRAPPIGLELPIAARAVTALTLFRQGAASALSNPKVLLFFGAFVSQFIDPDRPLVPQFFIMAGTFAVTETATEWGLAASAHKVRRWLARVGRRFNHFCGALFVAIGVALPLRG